MHLACKGRQRMTASGLDSLISSGTQLGRDAPDQIIEPGCALALVGGGQPNQLNGAQTDLE